MNTPNERMAIEALSANVLDTRFEDFDQATINNAKNIVIDTIGCAIGGANAPGNPELINLVRDWGGKKEATILVHGGKAPVYNVAMVNSIMVRSYDFGVVMFAFEGKSIGSPHNAETIVPTAITLGEANEINGKEMLTAMLVGEDVSSRLALASRGYAAPDSVLGGSGGIMTNSSFGATATAGRLLGLNKFQMRNAFGVVLELVGGSGGGIWDGATTFKFCQGVAARNAIFAAELARAGWIGVKDAFLGRFGYYNLYHHGCNNPEILTKELGKKYYAESCFKPYPSGRPTHGPIDCALALVHKHDIKAEDIQEIIVSLTRQALDGKYAKPFQIGDFPQCDATFSYQYTVATALLRGSVKLNNFTEESIRDPKVNALISKMKLAEWPGSLAAGPELGDVGVKVKMRDGREFSESTAIYKGDPVSKPLSRDEILAKFWSQVEFSNTVSKKDAEKIVRLVEKLEEVDNVNRIINLAVRR